MANQIKFDYDHYIVAYSGGKDSTACVLHLLECGVPANRIELWHHDVDGNGNRFMDWPVTGDYCRKFAKAIGCEIYFSWRHGGFKREMLRENATAAPISFEQPGADLYTYEPTRSKASTRRKFPQLAADLNTRWCSAALKIDVGRLAINKQDRFLNKKTLFITGERAEESPARAKYETFEIHKCDNRNGKRVRRHVDAWRPIHGWTESEVWEIIERHSINPHPAYHLGWGRLSCATCIFGSCHQWCSYNKINPTAVSNIAAFETEFDCTIKRGMTVLEQVAAGHAYVMDAEMAAQSQSDEYLMPIIIDDWTMPQGAFGDASGPS